MASTEYLSVGEVLDIHRLLVKRSGGSCGVRDMNGLKSAVAQPQSAFGGTDLYPSLAEKTAALGYSLINNHPFVDGNKRIGHAAMEAFLMLNNHDLEADVDDSEQLILGVAAGNITRLELVDWLKAHIQEKD